MGSLSAFWGASGQVNRVTESLSGLNVLTVWRLTHWDACVDPGEKAESGGFWPNRRIWGEDGCSHLIAGSGIFCHSEWIIQDSYFSLTSCWEQWQDSLALPLEASPCWEKRWEQSILPLISNSGQIVVGRLNQLAKWESASLGAQLSILVLSPSAGHPELTVCWSHRSMSKAVFFKVLVTLYNNWVAGVVILNVTVRLQEENCLVYNGYRRHPGCCLAVL